MQPRLPTVSGRWVVIVVLFVIVAVIGIATVVFLIKNPLREKRGQSMLSPIFVEAEHVVALLQRARES
jgi:hypothetical protein